MKLTVSKMKVNATNVIFFFLNFAVELLLFLSIAVDRFPCVERERTDSTSETSSTNRARGASTNSGKLQDHSHTREVIFALPSLQLHLKTEHLQTAKTPDVMGKLKLLFHTQRTIERTVTNKLINITFFFNKKYKNTLVDI